MTSAPSLRQRLGGNKHTLLALLLVLFTGVTLRAQNLEQVAHARVKVQLLLPLFLEAPYDQKGLDLQWQRIAVSYYQGVLMALDSLEKTGIQVELYVDDYQRDTSEIKRILEKPSRKDVDLIIGPLYKNGFAVAERYSAKNKIPLLSPFLTFQSSAANAYTISANPSIELYGQQLANYFNTSLDSCNVVLIHDNSKTDQSFSKAFLARFNTKRNNLLVQYTYTRGKGHPASALRFNAKNLVVIPSNDERTVNTLVYQLHDTIADKPMSIFGMQPWLDFSNVNYKVWDTVDLHLLTPYFINYQDTRVKQFVKNFRDQNKTDPDEYAFRGYDQMLVMAYLLANYGKNFTDTSSAMELEALHNHFQFARTDKGKGIENHSLNLLRFNEFRFTRVK